MNNKSADQTARMRRLVCAFVVHKPRRQVSRVEAHMVSMSFYTLDGQDWRIPNILSLYISALISVIGFKIDKFISQTKSILDYISLNWNQQILLYVTDN